MKFDSITIIFAIVCATLVSAGDKWPAKWCDKQCTEAVLFAKTCDKVKDIRNCLCSNHFHTKLMKCKADGCGENYKHKNWCETIDPLLQDCHGEYYNGPI